MKSRILFSLLMAVGLASCYKLDRFPLYTGSSDSWYSTEEEVEMSLKNLYREEFWDIDALSWTDDVQTRNTAGPMTGGTLNSQNSDVASRWSNCYKAIARANTIIYNLQHNENLEIPQDKIDLYIAEALFVRAAEYAMLVTYFGDVVYTETPLSIEEAKHIGRTDKETILENVYRDFDIAAEVLPKETENRANKGVVYALKARYALYNGDWEIAYKAAKACMDLNVYELYPDYSELFLSKTRNSVESILVFPGSIEYGFLYKDTGSIKGFVTRNRGGYASSFPSLELLCSYLCTDGLPIDESPLFNPNKPFENRDPRCTATIVEFETEHLSVIYDPNPLVTKVYSKVHGGEITNKDCFGGDKYASYTGLVLKKGVDESWVNNGTFEVEADLIYIRYAEVLLTYAEAKIEAGEIDQSVLDAINMVRARAYGVDYTETGSYPAVTTTDQNELRKAVRIERRMELAFEGNRYIDLIRWRLAEKVFNTPYYKLLTKDALIEKVVNPGKWFFSADADCKIEVDENGFPDLSPLYKAGLLDIASQRMFDASRQYLWPIPADEVLSNPNLGQNDNY